MQVLCPLCQAHVVEAPSWSFGDNSVDVPVGGEHPGVVSVSLRVSALIDLAVPVNDLVQSDGLVVFA